ncbi:transcriptional adapter 3 [Drosophila subobscura]|uniref:transcriptional adapter 3 n=1 Tax=Drosophila subobscura TaxID=7241 RepID=UPI00155AE936|nr:transcriptional adapter 3 [Drosophila subobscura]
MSTTFKNLKLGHFGGGGAGIVGGGGAGGSIGGAFGMAISGGVAGKMPLNGGGGGGGKGASAAAAAESEVFLTPSGVIIPLIRTRDMPKRLPTMSAALQRPSDDHLSAEDLDAVQLELEQLLSNVALRARVLKAEYDSVDKDEKRNDRRKFDRVAGSPPCTSNNAMLNAMLGIGVGGASGGLGSPSGTSSSLAKRKRDEPTGVRKKHSSMTILKGGLGPSGNSRHSKNSPMAVHTDDSLDFLPSSNLILPMLPQLPKLAMPKNDMPNKFWLSVEPYCMPITNEDLRLIDDLLEQYRGPLVPPVPTLGPHYSTVWALEDMKALQPGGSRIKSQNASAMMKKAEGMVEESITGPLTQRLVTALMEESLLTLPSEQAAVGEHSNSTTSSSNDNSHTHSHSHSHLSSANSGAPAASGNFRPLSMLKHGVGIEQRLKKELLENGLMDASDCQPPEDMDDVLHEIKRVTSEISTVSTFNSEELKRLRVAASDEIKRIELKHKLDMIDTEILECYKRMLQYRAKRKGHTVEEKQEILRLTKEQRILADQLERMNILPPLGPSSNMMDGKL